jgi:cytochrome c oxidase assembly factor CtaG
MTPNAQAILESWSAPIGVNVSLCLAALVYTKGWLHLHKTFPNLISICRLAAFLAGIASLWIAIGSPLEAFDDVSFSVHMVQHLLLMAVAPPLILLGAPALPLLHGLPRMIRGAVGQFLHWSPARRLGRFFTDPAICWIAAAVALIAWHIPAAFELALRSDWWHEVEHACFFTTSLLFWWPVIQPFPSVARWPGWSIPLYLFLGTLPGGALGAFLTFCDRVLYPSYASAPMIFQVSALDDQVFAGALMWVFGTFVYMVPAVILTVQLLSGNTAPSPDEMAMHRRKLASQAYGHSRAEVV